MEPFSYSRDLNDIPRDRDMRFLAGGTTLVDLMKLQVEKPELVVDITRNDRLRRIDVGDDGVRLGALVTMAEAADHRDIKRRYPVIAQSLALAASPQIRNMASLAGNLLQRTRCTYFRDVSYEACNKRNPGSGCSALHGVNRMHAVLGTNDNCIATYPGDFAQAMIALDGRVETRGPDGGREIKVAELHRPPEDRPDRETVLKPGEMIETLTIPTGDFRRSLYLKIRDRESYEFALASAAVALDLADDSVRDARIALGGLAYRPWRAAEAEDVLRGKPLDEAQAERAAEAAFANARPMKHNRFKIELGKQALIRALIEARDMEV
jgi:xanthine dehydrogenase YagS FAD-binding subunit